MKYSNLIEIGEWTRKPGLWSTFTIKTGYFVILVNYYLTGKDCSSINYTVCKFCVTSFKVQVFFDIYNFSTVLKKLPHFFLK